MASINETAFPCELDTQENESAFLVKNLYSESEVIKLIENYLRKICSQEPFKLNNRATDIYISLSTLSLISAVYAAFFNLFPDRQKTLLLCVAWHFGCLLLWAVLDFLIIKSIYLRFTNENNSLFGITSTLHRKSGDVTIKLYRFPSNNQSIQSKELTLNLGQLFYTTQHLNQKILYDNFKSLYEQLIGNNVLTAQNEKKPSPLNKYNKKTSFQKRK